MYYHNHEYERNECQTYFHSTSFSEFPGYEVATHLKRLQWVGA